MTLPLQYAPGADRANIGCKPLGRGAVPSPVVAEEIRLHKLYVADMKALPPANTPENARQHRIVAVRHNPSLAQTFRELKLSL